MTAGDFNRDGRLDIALSNRDGSGTVSILPGNGDGTFGVPTRFSTGFLSCCTAVMEGDFNRDGKLDLAIAGFPNISILAGNGDGTFSSRLDVSTDIVASGGTAAAGDFNGDGRLDLAFAVSGTFDGRTFTSAPRISVLLNASLPTNTPVGPSVVVNLVDSTTGTTSATATFARVTQAGTTAFSISSGGPPPPSGFRLGNPPIYFGLSTTAAFSGSVEACINYSGISFGNPSALKIFHSENGAWVNVTTSLDTTNKIICGSVTSFSAFGIFEPANQPPVANAGPDQTVECASHAGTAVTLDGSKSSDPDGDPLSFEWRDANGHVVGTTAQVNVSVPLGTSTFTLTVNDGKGGTATDTVVITVHDTTPPVLNVTLSPRVLWPPDHRLVPVTATIQLSDGCDSNAIVELVSVTSSEPDNGLGDGDTAADIQGASSGTDDRSFFLRAERSGLGVGRIYTVRYRARDASGNVTFATAQVRVPHDQP